MAEPRELNRFQERRFWDWVMTDQGDTCCCDVRIFSARPETLEAWYRCPVCGDIWSIEADEESIMDGGDPRDEYIKVCER